MKTQGTPSIVMRVMGTPCAVRTLIKYQSKGIASRTLIESMACTVTLFAFDARQAISEHSAPFNAMVYVVEGALEISLAGTPHAVAAGDTLVMPANVPHALRARRKSIMMLVMARK